MIDIKKYEDYFERFTEMYLDNSNTESEHLHLYRKKYHSIRVKECAIKISNMLKFTKYEMQLMELIALFHDIGRFEQFRKYNTYVDSKSENHGILGAKILRDNKVFSTLPYEDIELILKCIELHNVKDLPNNLDKKIYKFVTVLRDADKIDWLYACANIIPNIPKREQKTFFCDNEKEHGIKEEIVKDIILCKSIDKRLLNTQDEVRAFGLGYITSGLVYKESINIIKQENILDKIYNQMEKNKQSEEIYNFIKKKID